MTTSIRMGTPVGRWVLAATIGGSGLALLDSTVVNVALPTIGLDLGADFTQLQWIVNGYALSLAALILLGGSLGDRFGRRRVFLIGTVWFAVASVLCGLAPNVETLIAARVLQGVGGALLTPGSLAIIAASFDPTDRSRAVGAWSGLGGVAGAIGPFLGGALVEWNWRAVFLINVPIAAAVVLITLRHVPETRDTEVVGRIDVPGAALAVVGLGSLTYALTELGQRGADVGVGIAAVLGVGGLAAFIVVERRTSHPLIPLSMFANRIFTAVNIVTFLVYAGLSVFFFLLVLQLQTVAGFPPTIAGIGLLPVTLLMLLLSSRAGALADRIGPWIPLTFGPLIVAAGFLLALRIGPGASYFGDVLPAAVAVGLGLSLTVAPLTATVLAASEEHLAGTASGINNAVARSAGLLAVAVIPVAAGLAGEDYAIPEAFDSGFKTSMLIGAALLVIGSALSAVLVRPRGGGPLVEDDLKLPECMHCGVIAPQLHPGPARAG